MNRTIYIAFLGWLLLGIFSCKKDTPNNPHDPNTLPPLTHEGKNTFGCLVNGEVWVAYAPFTVGGAISLEGNFNDVTGNFNLRGLNKEKSQTIHLWLSGLFGVGEYDINVENYDIDDIRGYRNSSEIHGCLGEANYKQELLRKITVCFIDKNNRIISGTFEMDLVNSLCPDDTIRIREGRFDWRY